MPRVLRKGKRRSRGYNATHIEHLRSGFSVYGLSGFDTEDALRWGWVDLKAEVMRQWIADKPFSRPFAWWACDAPARRERIDGGQHPHDDPLWCAQAEANKQAFPHSGVDFYTLYFGKPRVLLFISDDHRAKYESEREYLTRLNLLTPEEVELCRE